MGIFERGPKKEEKAVLESPEDISAPGENNSNEDPNLEQDAENQVRVDEDKARELLERIQQGVFKDKKAVPEDERRKLLKIKHNRWIEEAKDVAKSFGYSVTALIAVDLILRHLGIEIPSYILAPITMPQFMNSFGKKKAENN